VTLGSVDTRRGLFVAMVQVIAGDWVGSSDRVAVTSSPTYRIMCRRWPHGITAAAAAGAWSLECGRQLSVRFWVDVNEVDAIQGTALSRKGLAPTA